jgi:hypothetical protein
VSAALRDGSACRPPSEPHSNGRQADPSLGGAARLA